MGRTECRPGARSGCGSERTIASCNRSRLVKITSGRGGSLPGLTNWNGEEGCGDDEYLAVTSGASAQLQLRDHALQCPPSWRAVAYREKLRHDATGYQAPDCSAAIWMGVSVDLDGVCDHAWDT